MPGSSSWRRAESCVLLADARIEDDALVLPYDRAMVKDAPKVDDDGHIGDHEQAQLYRYYGLAGVSSNGHDGLRRYGGRRDLRRRHHRQRRRRRERGRRGRARHLRADDGRAITRSEERLSVGTETRESGRARLRQYVVTERKTVTVPVTRKEVRIEREPITDANRGEALDGPAISEEEHEVVLHEERPVVQTELVPVERVRLGKEMVTDQQRVTEEVRKEQIDTDGDGVTDRG